MRWTIDDMPAPDIRVFCDGKEIKGVYAFDTEAGWVAARCLDGGKKHQHPFRADIACERVLHGHVSVEVGQPTVGQFDRRDRHTLYQAAAIARRMGFQAHADRTLRLSARIME